MEQLGGLFPWFIWLMACTWLLGEGNGTLLQYSCLENPMDRGAYQAPLSMGFSSTLAWKIPWTEEPGRLHHGVAKSPAQLSDFTFTFPFMHWRRKWQPTPMFLPGEAQGRGSLVGCCLWGRTELDSDLAGTCRVSHNI